MPNLRVDLSESRRLQITQIGDALHRALVEGLGMLDDDFFQVFTVHSPGELRFSRTFPDAARTDIIFVQVIANLGYTADDKQSLYTAIAHNVTSIGIRPDELLVSIHEVNPVNWFAPSKPLVMEA